MTKVARPAALPTPAKVAGALAAAGAVAAGAAMARPPETPKPQPTQQPQFNPLQGVAALGQATRTLQSTLGQVAGALQKAGQTIASGAQTVAREAGKFAAWTEQQQEQLFQGKVTPATVIGTAASFILPTTALQIIGGQKKADIGNPETAIGLGSDILSVIPVLGAVGKVVKGGAVAAKAATAATKIAKVETAAQKVVTNVKPIQTVVKTAARLPEPRVLPRPTPPPRIPPMTKLAEVARPAAKLAEAARPVAKAPAVARLIPTSPSLESIPTRFHMSWLLKAVGQAARRIEPIAVKAATQAKPAVQRIATQAKPAIQTAVKTAAKLPAPAKVLGALGATAAGLSMAIAAQHPKAPPYRAIVVDYKPPPPPPPGAKCENRGGVIVCTKESQPTEQDKAFWESYKRTQELQKQQEEILQLMRQRIQDWKKVQAMQIQYGFQSAALAPPPSFSDLEKRLADIQKELKSPQPQPSPPPKPAQWHALASPPPKPQPSQPAPAQPKQLIPTWVAIGAGAAGLAAAVGALLARKPGLLKIAAKPVNEAVAKKPTVTSFLSIFRRTPVAKTEAKVSEIAKAARIGAAEKTAMQASTRAARQVAARAAAKNIMQASTRAARLAKLAKVAKYGAGIGALGLVGYGVYRMFTGAEGAVGAEQAQPEAAAQAGAGAGAAGVQMPPQMPQSQITESPGQGEVAVGAPQMLGVGGAGAVDGGEAGVVGTNVGPLGGYVPPTGGYGAVGEAGVGGVGVGVGGAPGAVGGLGGFVQSHLLWILGGVALIVIIALLLSRK
jgi:hypothetical protein